MLVVDMPVKRFDLTLRVNLYGTFIWTKAVLPTMIKQKSCIIINISTHGRRMIDTAVADVSPLKDMVAMKPPKVPWSISPCHWLRK